MSRYWDEYPRYTPRARIEVDDGIKARNARKGFASQWWAKRWIAALDSFGWSNRLHRGKSYASSGQVVRYEVTAGRITAEVQGSRPRPYRVTIDLKPLADSVWEGVLDRMAEQAIFAAQLLAGEMPQDIETLFTAAGASLMPVKSVDLVTACSCPDWANPCKHIAAVYYIVAEAFDQDPFLIFRLRGRTQEQVVTGLRQRRAGEVNDDDGETGPVAPQTEPLPLDAHAFWTARPVPSNLDVGLEPPRVACSILRRLGAPGSWTDAGELVGVLGPAYATVSLQARILALGEEGVRATTGGATRRSTSRRT